MREPVEHHGHERTAHAVVADAERPTRNRVVVFAYAVFDRVGDCLVGNIGSADRFEYTAIGDTVNQASGWRVSTSSTAPGSC